MASGTIPTPRPQPSLLPNGMVPIAEYGRC
jgi:hypothetical protein